MARLKIALLGPPQITIDGVDAVTDRHKAIGLLAYLAAEAKSHRREALAALLWPDYPKASAYSYLRRTLWELNRMLGKGWIESDRQSVTLVHQPSLEVDLEAFHRCLTQATDLVRGLTEAINLYRGSFLEGLVIADTAPFEEWQSLQAEFYQREVAQAIEKLVDILEHQGEYGRALPYAQRWLALDRLNEAAYRAVMRQLAGLGERNAAIRLYQTCIKVLNDELGVAPQGETEQLYQAILHNDLPEAHIMQAEQPLLLPAAKTPGNLPSSTTPFIGRRAEIEQIHTLVLDQGTRLLTLTGLGGTGKTRLSIQVAAELNGKYPDGVWFVPLAAVHSLNGMITATASGLGFSFYTGEVPPRQQLLDFLRNKRLLLIFDNFEHLTKVGGELLVEILEKAPGVKLLVTSRQRLNLQAEQVYQVAGMQIPDQATMAGWENPAEQVKAYSAIQLLLERGRRIRPDFQLTPQNLDSVILVCQLVEGSPLGIELAVPWLAALSIEEIGQEITRSLDFLQTGAVDIPDRQRSLRAVFDTSWKLLDELEQQAFQQLCVFAGSFSRQAAMEVSGCTLQTLLSLANKSWLQPIEAGRYQLHEVLKQYGLERLQADPGAWREAKERHAAFFSSLLHDQEQILQTSKQVQALEVLKMEMESNIPEAWGWLVSTGQIHLLVEKMLLGLFHYWLIRRVSVDFLGLLKHARQAVPIHDDRASQRYQAILETVEITHAMVSADFTDQPKERLKNLIARVMELGLEDELGLWYIVLVYTYGFNVNYEQGYQLFKALLPKIDSFIHPWEHGYTCLIAAQFCTNENREDEKKYLIRALAVFKEIGVLHEQGVTLQLLGQSASSAADYQMAVHYLQSSLGYFEIVGDLWGADQTWMILQELYLYSGHIEQAFQAFEASRSFNERVGNRRAVGLNLSWQSLATSRYGSLESALELRLKSLDIAREVGKPFDIAWHTWELGEIYRLMGDIEQAKKYYLEALPQFEMLQDYLGLGFFHRGYGDIAMMLSNWPEARREFEQALEYQEKEQRRFRAWGLIYYQARLGLIMVKLGDLNQAREHLRMALSIADGWAYPDIKALPLIGVASLLLQMGHPAQAIDVATFVYNHRATWNEVKQQAAAIIQQAKQGTLQPEEPLSQPQAQELDIHQLIKDYLHSPHLESKSIRL